jgi:hypothetical protein
LEQGKAPLLNGPVGVGVLHEQPGGRRTVRADQRAARPAVLGDDRLHPCGVRPVHRLELLDQRLVWGLAGPELRHQLLAELLVAVAHRQQFAAQRGVTAGRRLGGEPGRKGLAMLDGVVEGEDVEHL